MRPSSVFIIFVTLFVLGSSSCSKFLEESSQSEIVPRSAQSLNELLLGAGYQPYTNALHPAVRFFHDDVEDVTDEAPNYDHYYWTWQPDLFDMAGDSRLKASPWTGYYNLIQVCNTVLDYLPKVTGEDKFKAYIAGQAYLLRAFYYFKLVNFYGLPYTDEQSDPHVNLGVPLILFSGVSLEHQARNTVEEVYQQVLADVNTGIQLLEESRTKHNVYRIGSVAGHFLASRIHLYMGNWSESIKHANRVLQENNNLADLSSWGPANPRAKPVIGPGNPESIWLFGSIGDVNSYFRDSNGRLSFSLENSFEATDLRNGIYFANNIGIKLPNVHSLGGSGQVFRVSEVYLNRAEAQAHLFKEGKPEKGQAAIDDLNTLREKRFMPEDYQELVLPEANALIQLVREERRRELFDESEHRWFDLRRYGMPSIEHFYSPTEGVVERYVLEERDPFYTLPIPQVVLDRNIKLDQNPLGQERLPK